MGGCWRWESNVEVPFGFALLSSYALRHSCPPNFHHPSTFLPSQPPLFSSSTLSSSRSLVMASWLTFSQPVDVDIRLEGEQDRKTVEVKMDKDRKENCPIYFDGEGVVGQVSG